MINKTVGDMAIMFMRYSFLIDTQSSGKNHFHNLAVPANLNLAGPTTIPNITLTPYKKV